LKGLKDDKSSCKWNRLDYSIFEIFTFYLTGMRTTKKVIQFIEPWKICFYLYRLIISYLHKNGFVYSVQELLRAVNMFACALFLQLKLLNLYFSLKVTDGSGIVWNATYSRRPCASKFISLCLATHFSLTTLVLTYLCGHETLSRGMRLMCVDSDVYCSSTWLRIFWNMLIFAADTCTVRSHLLDKTSWLIQQLCWVRYFVWTSTVFLHSGAEI